MLKSILFLLFFSLLIVGCGETGTSIVSEEVFSFISASNKELLKSVNIMRSKQIDCQDGHGLVGPVPPLKWNENLSSSSYEHAYDLAESNTFSHDGSGTIYDVTGLNNNNQSTFIERIEANGYVNYRAIGENIAGGFNTIDTAIEAWIKSPSHCANLMSDKFTETGIASFVNEDSRFKIYWTQNFGSKGK